MANLKVTICVRPKRGWAKATNTDSGPFFLRWYTGSLPHYKKVDGGWDEAEIALIKLERKLKACSQGFALADDDETPVAKSHLLRDVVNVYIADLKLNRRPQKTITGKRAILDAFVAHCKREFVEQVTRHDIIAYRNALKDAGLDTRCQSYACQAESICNRRLTLRGDSEATNALSACAYGSCGFMPFYIYSVPSKLNVSFSVGRFKFTTIKRRKLIFMSFAPLP